MWLLAELFEQLPEVGDLDKPKLVFLFDEAHLLFADASKAFLQAVQQTVKLIRSKGVGVFFCTQLPTDVPGPVLSQLGARIQHALRAFTPDDQKALVRDRQDLPDHRGLRPVQRADQPGHRRGDRHRAVREGRADPGGLDQGPGAALADGAGAGRRRRRRVAGSPLMAKYGQDVDRQSAYEMLTARVAPPGAPPASGPVTIPHRPGRRRRADHRRRRLADADPRAVQPVPGRRPRAAAPPRAPRPPGSRRTADGGGLGERAEQPGGHLVHEVARHLARRGAGPVGVRHPQAAALTQPVSESTERSSAGSALTR